MALDQMSHWVTLGMYKPTYHILSPFKYLVFRVFIVIFIYTYMDVHPLKKKNCSGKLEGLKKFQEIPISLIIRGY